MATIGEVIKSIRLKLNVSQKVFADMVGMCEGAIIKIENGQSVPHQSTIRKIETVFNIAFANFDFTGDRIVKMRHVCENIIFLQELFDLTNAALAKKCDISRQSITDIHHRRYNPRINTILKFANIFECPPELLMEESLIIFSLKYLAMHYSPELMTEVAVRVYGAELEDDRDEVLMHFAKLHESLQAVIMK